MESMRALMSCNVREVVFRETAEERMWVDLKIIEEIIDRLEECRHPHPDITQKERFGLPARISKLEQDLKVASGSEGRKKDNTLLVVQHSRDLLTWFSRYGTYFKQMEELRAPWLKRVLFGIHGGVSLLH